MVRRYAIILKSQLGPKAGKLRIRESGDRILCILELLGHKSKLTGKKPDRDGFFRFAGKMWTPLGLKECSILYITEDQLASGALYIDGKVYELSGKEF